MKKRKLFVEMKQFWGAAWLSVSAILIAVPMLAEPPRHLGHFDMMPKPVLLPDNTMAAYSLPQRGPGLEPTPLVQDMFAQYSKDGGKTWTDPESLFTLPSEAGGFGYFVVQVDQEGEVHFIVLGDGNTGVMRPKPEGAEGPKIERIQNQSLDIWHVKSEKTRTAWTEARMIWEGRAGDPQSITLLKNGRLLLPISYYKQFSWRNRGDTDFETFTFHGQFRDTALYSDDNGQTWQQSESVLKTPVPSITGAYGAVEPVVVELLDGRVWMLLRTQNGRFYESFSEDYGTTWSPTQPTNILSSDSPAGFVRMPDDRLVMMWNNCQRYPYGQGSRRALHAAISDDDGQTWKGYREVALDPFRNNPPPGGGDHGMSYPFPALTVDGLGVIYSLYVQSGEGGREMLRFDADWLTQTSRQDDFKQGLEGWSTYGTQRVEIVDAEGADDGKAMSLTRSDVDWPTGATWNFPGGPEGSLKTRLKLERDAGPWLLMLTDHFSSPFDAEDQFHSVFNLQIEADGSLPIIAGITPDQWGTNVVPLDEWVDLELRWNFAKNRCQMLLNGEVVTTLPQLKHSDQVSYFRVRSTANQAKAGSLLLDRVDAEITD